MEDLKGGVAGGSILRGVLKVGVCFSVCQSPVRVFLQSPILF